MDEAILGLERDPQFLDLEQAHEYLILGSMNAYAMSTTKFAITMKNAPKRTVPWITGRSALMIPSYASRPTPGMLKTVSVKIAPPSRVPMSRPRTVTIG